MLISTIWNTLILCRVQLLYSLPAQVPARDLVKQALASHKDGDVLCQTGQALALAKQSHEEDAVYQALWDANLLLRVPWTHVNLGGSLPQHPCLHPRDMITAAAERGKLQQIIGAPLDTCSLAAMGLQTNFYIALGSCVCCASCSGEFVLTDFWEKFEAENPQHPVVSCFREGLDKGSLVPINLHGDGGRAYRKSEIMILQWQSGIGQGTRLSNAKRKLQTRHDVCPAQINLAGHSLSTRFLVSCMRKKYYDQDPSALLELLGCISDWFGALFTEGIYVDNKLFKFLPLGLKGDLVFQQKAAGLKRAFSHVRKRRPNAKSKALPGVCWLCKAGTPQASFPKSPKIPSTLKYNIPSPMYSTYHLQ